MKHIKIGHGLVVVRISDSSAIRELDKKVKETAESHRSIPGADTLAKLGAIPLREPDKVNGRAFSGPGFHAVLFRIPGTQTQVLLALGSATKVNLGEDDNAFVRILADTLAEKPVEFLWVADFARLLRSIDYLSDTWKAIRIHCRYIHHGGAVIDTAGPTAEIQFLFEALSAAADARSVVKRTTTGKMRTYLRGACPLAAASVPFGFQRLPDGALTVDCHNPPDVIQEIVHVLGDPTLTDAQRVARVAAAGGVSKFRDGRPRRTPMPVDRLNSPSTTVGRWYGFLDIWREGIWEVDYELPAILNQVTFDLPVEIDDRRDMRVWRMKFNLAVPDGGFASADAFDAAEELRDRRRVKSTPTGGAAAGAVRKPFCGLPSWDDGEHQFALFSRRKGLYELRRRPLRVKGENGGRVERAEGGWGRRPAIDGSVVAVIAASELHTQVPTAIADALATGLTMHGMSDALLASDERDEVVEALREQLATVRRTVKNARRNANAAATESQREAFLRDMQVAEEEVASLEADLLRLAAGASGAIPVDANQLAEALASIASQPDHVPGPVADAYRTILHGFRLRTLKDATAEFETHVRIPLVGGTLTVGPVRGTVDTGTSRGVAAHRTSSLPERASEAASLVMADGLDVRAAAKQLQVATHRRVAQTVRDHLKSLGLGAPAASLLVAQGTTPARAAVWERLHGRPLPATVSRPLGAHLVDVYLSPDCPAADHQRARTEAGITRVLQLLADQGGWLPDSERGAVSKAANVSIVTLNYMATGRWRKSRFIPPVLDEVDGGIGLRPCPHADCNGWATNVCTLPEVSSLVLCDQCLRMPVVAYDTVVFTNEYHAGPAT